MKGGSPIKMYGGIDERGKRFGRWVAISYEGNRHWLCQCDCGVKKLIDGRELRKGSSKSCGCLRSELSREQMTTHGGSYTKLFNVWHSMIRRCHYEKHKSYASYGGRGIGVCDRWRTFVNFKADMGSSWKEGLSIDRIDNDKGYSLENCRWTTMKVQANNRRSNTNIEYNGKVMTLSQWAQSLNLNPDTLFWRIKKYGIVPKIFTSTKRNWS